MRDSISEADLCLPSTSNKHIGPVDTWTTPDGFSTHLINYVMVPASLGTAVQHSQLVEHFNLGKGHADQFCLLGPFEPGSCLAVTRSKRFEWLWSNLKYFCDLGHPTTQIERWLEIAQHHRSYWKRLIKRAVTHAIQQRAKFSAARPFTLDCAPGIISSNTVVPANASEVSGCVTCRQRFRSLGGEGAHMNRKHRILHPARFLFDSTQCGGCLKDFLLARN
eukprot:s1505_g3.t1